MQVVVEDSEVGVEEVQEYKWEVEEEGEEEFKEHKYYLWQTQEVDSRYTVWHTLFIIHLSCTW